MVRVSGVIEVEDLTEAEPRISVDIEKMQRVFINIISNAVEAMPNGGRLAIKSSLSGDHLEVAFTDTGVGMPRDFLEKLWTPLHTTKAKGMGLGLAICKRFVEVHGGSIVVDSTAGKGTTFTISVPIDPLSSNVHQSPSLMEEYSNLL